MFSYQYSNLFLLLWKDTKKEQVSPVPSSVLHSSCCGSTAASSPSHVIHNEPLEKTVYKETLEALKRIGFKENE